MVDKDSKKYKEGVRVWYFWAVLIAALIVGGQIAFLIALSRM